MKLILAGLGRFGIEWYRLLKRKVSHFTVAVVDPDLARIERFLEPGDRFYPSLETTLESESPDFLLNATPPAVHTPLNLLAFEHRLPVLCEKPVAEDYHEAEAVVARAMAAGVPFMIAENYRRAPLARLLKQLITEGAIGEITTIHFHFFQNLKTDKPYLLAMPDPLLVDVSVHHLDMLRYLTGSQGRRIFAHNYNPPGSLYPGNAAVNMVIEMENGVQVSYAGSLAAVADHTSWVGHWRIEGRRGVLLAGNDIRLVRDGRETRYDPTLQLSLQPALDDFLQALATGLEPETSARDYLNSQKMVYYAEESDRRKQMVWIE